MPSLIMHWGIKSSRVDTAWRLSTGGVWQWLWSHGERRPMLQEKIINEGKGEKKTLPQPIIKSYVLFRTRAGRPWISCTFVVGGKKKKTEIKMPLLYQWTVSFVSRIHQLQAFYLTLFYIRSYFWLISWIKRYIHLFLFFRTEVA